MTSAEELMRLVRFNMAPGPLHEPDCIVSPAPAKPAVRLIAYYLPQFHPIPENDKFWGKGFTEWTNVTKAVPQFPGHYQPHLPADLGFYDLRLVDTLRRQASLARKNGIHGFCFHYYWFGGKRVLETPLNLLLQNPDIDLPFCICWANENWTRRWDGHDDHVLMKQNYSSADDVAFVRSLEPAINDPRYIRVRGQPLILLYRANLLPNVLATVRRWRQHLAGVGCGNPYLVIVQSFSDVDPRHYGFDATVEFPPHRLGFGERDISSEIRFFDPNNRGKVVEYDEMVRRAATISTGRSYTLFRGVCPAWDNEPRQPGHGFAIVGSTPKKYQDWLASTCRETLKLHEPDERLVFINAWNEWAEGAHLEPDRHFGHAYLHATARALRSLATPTARRLAVVSHDAYFHGAQMLALHIVRTLVEDFGVEVRVLLGGPGELEEEFRRTAPTERMDGFADAAAWEAVARRLHADGYTAALCNTLVSAQAIEPLTRAGLDVVSLVHELPTLIRAYGLVDAARSAAERARCVVFASAYVRDRFVELAGPIAGRNVIRPQGIFLPPAPEPERRHQRAEARAMLKAGPDDLIVMGVGYGDRRKGIDMWPALMRRVLARCPNALFVWVGRVEQSIVADFEREVARVGVGGRLRRPGNIMPLQPMYAAADVFLLSSREDPFPNVVLEAMAHGLPVTAFEGSGGITELVRETGSTLTALEDVDGMANALIDLLTDDRGRLAIGRKGAERLSQDFRFTDYVSDLVALTVSTVRTVSVVVPNYNYAAFLRQRMDSIWSQTYPIHEVILLDDGSTDNSADVIADLKREAGDRLHVVMNATNSGSVSRQWARGVEVATGDLVWIAEADDFAEPGFLASVVAAFDDPEIVLSYSQSRQVNGDGQVTAESYLDYVADVDAALWREDYSRAGATEIAEALSVKNTIPNVSAVVFRRDVLSRVLAEHLEKLTSYRNAADWYCYLHVLVHGMVAFRAASLNNHRRHGTSVTMSSIDSRHLWEIGAMQRLAAELARVPPERTAAAEKWYAAVERMFEASTASDLRAVG
jgi:O-antigen biosynthesis protein